MKKFYLLTLLFASTFSLSFAQSFKERADKEYELFRFRHAVELYLKADTNNIDVISKLGIAYKKINFYKEAEYWMNKQALLENQPSSFFLDYAEILANNERYSESETFYKRYLAISPKDVRTINQAKSFSKLNEMKRDSINWHISYLALNTPMDEFSPIYFNKGLIFTSNRMAEKGIKNTFSWNQSPYTDLYLLPDTTGIKYLKPDYYFSDLTNDVKIEYKERQLPKTIQDSKVLGEVSYPAIIKTSGINTDTTNVVKLSSIINSQRHDGPMSLNAAQDFAFFNRNKNVKSDVENAASIRKLDLYSATYKNGVWSAVRPFEHNNSEYSTAHPALSPDGNTLYFVSDMPGGYGGKDLYYSVKTGNSWSTPINMGPKINTEGDETFPYVSASGIFYFSSNGYAGLGGLDLLKVELRNHEPISEVENLGYPINSSKDDFGFIIDEKTKSGYFSSNRFGSDDIFKFNYNPIIIKLEGRIYANTNNKKESISNVLVVLKQGSKTDSVYTDNSGYYSFPLNRELEYTITASKTGYEEPANAEVSTLGIIKSTTLVKDLELTLPVIPEISGCIYAGTDIKIDHIFYDLDKFFIRNDALPAMNKVLSILNKHPEISLQIKSHTDSRASAAYNEVLSKNRANAVINWLVERGINKSRLTGEYFGKRVLVNGCGDNANCTEDFHQLNRRSELYLFANGKNLTLDCETPPEKVVPVTSPLVNCEAAQGALKLENIFYDLDKFFIRNDALPAMHKLLSVLNTYPDLDLKIKSHTDSRASAAYNLKLSNNRANAVITWLVERGIKRSRLTGEYFGKRILVNGCSDGVNCSEDVHQLNRRSEFYLFYKGKNLTIDCKL